MNKLENVKKLMFELGVTLDDLNIYETLQLNGVTQNLENLTHIIRKLYKWAGGEWAGGFASRLIYLAERDGKKIEELSENELTAYTKKTIYNDFYNDGIDN